MTAPNLKEPTSVFGKTLGYSATTTLATALSNASASGKALKIVSIYCANINGTNPVDIDLSYFNGSVDRYIAYTISVPADSTQVLVTREAPIYLQEGESLRAKAGSASALDLVICYEEIS